MLELMRSIVRPVLTLFGFIILSVMVYEGREVPQSYSITVTGIVLWWFGDRTLGKLVNGKK